MSIHSRLSNFEKSLQYRELALLWLKTAWIELAAGQKSPFSGCHSPQNFLNCGHAEIPAKSRSRQIRPSEGRC